MSGEERTGAEELRLIVGNMNCSRESFLDRYTAEQLVTLFRVQLACGWDFLPDSWTPRQVNEALRGIVPTWGDDEQPTYSKRVVERAHVGVTVHHGSCRCDTCEPEVSK